MTDVEGNGLQIAHLLIRFIAFAYLFMSMGVSMLKNPAVTLSRSLEYHQQALRQETEKAQWVLEQVTNEFYLISGFRL